MSNSFRLHLCSRDAAEGSTPSTTKFVVNLGASPLGGIARVVVESFGMARVGYPMDTCTYSIHLRELVDRMAYSSKRGPYTDLLLCTTGWEYKPSAFESPAGVLVPSADFFRNRALHVSILSPAFQVLETHPSVAMVASIQGGYTVSSGASYPGVPIWTLFNPAYSWTSADSYVSATGLPRTFDYITNTDTSVYIGNWMQLQAPYPVVLKTYQFTSATNVAGVPNGSMASWVVCGSNEGVTWYNLDLRTGQNTGLSTSSWAVRDGVPAFSFFRLVVTAKSPGTAQALLVSDLKFVATPSPVTDWEMVLRIEEPV